jgi:hypothetical protein
MILSALALVADAQAQKWVGGDSIVPDLVECDQVCQARLGGLDGASRASLGGYAVGAGRTMLTGLWIWGGQNQQSGPLDGIIVQDTGFRVMAGLNRYRTAFAGLEVSNRWLVWVRDVTPLPLVPEISASVVTDFKGHYSGSVTPSLGLPFLLPGGRYITPFMSYSVGIYDAEGIAPSGPGLGIRITQLGN